MFQGPSRVHSLQGPSLDGSTPPQAGPDADATAAAAARQRALGVESIIGSLHIQQSKGCRSRGLIGVSGTAWTAGTGTHVGVGRGEGRRLGRAAATQGWVQGEGAGR